MPVDAQNEGAKQQSKQGTAIGQAIGSNAAEGNEELAKERDAAKKIKAQVDQLMASKTPDKKAAQQLLNRIGEHKKTLRKLQAQQSRGQLQGKDLQAQDKLGNFEIQDLMSRYTQAERSLKSILAEKSGVKSH